MSVTTTLTPFQKSQRNSTSTAYLEILDQLLTCSSEEDDDLEIAHSAEEFFEIKEELQQLLVGLQKAYSLKTLPVIAGGCPRDIYRGADFSDIDIFIPVGYLGDIQEMSHTEAKLLKETYTDRLSNLLKFYPDLGQITYRDIPNHYQIPYLLNVFTIYVKGIKVQLILITVDNIEKVLDTFAVHISRVFFDENFNIKISKEAADDFENKTVTFSEKNQMSDKYFRKILLKFPGYKAISEV